MVNLFKTGSDGKASLSSDFVGYNNNTEFSRKRHIEELYDEVKNTIFEKSKATEEEKEYLMQFFNGAYGTAKAKFQGIKRNTGGRYFDHLIRVTHLMLTNSKIKTLTKVLISMYHDIIEDTDIDFYWLTQTHSCSKVALGVELISKEPFSNFIDKDEDLEDYKLFESIKKARVLNRKNLLSDNFLFRLQNHKKNYGDHRLTLKEYNSLPEEDQEDNISPKEWEAYDNYKLLEKNPKYKEKRNQKYFGHMINFNTFLEYGKELDEKYDIGYSDNRIYKICLEALEVKYWDRIDNLQTSEIYNEWNDSNLAKAKRKIEETEKYFYNISKETHPYIYYLIKAEVKRLENFIKKGVETTVSDTKSNVGELIKE